MYVRRRSSLVLLVSATLAGHSASIAQTTLTYPPAPVPVDEVAATMTVPEGFKVTLFAGEPDVVQPIAFTFDDRGRMWVAECLSYPKWTKDGTGRDRIVILEDTDGDGRHDVRKVFADNLANLSSLELGFGGVFICSLPELKFIPDRDGDDVPDGPAETLLDGWSLDCRHNVFNGLAWGPDGWLYGLNGILSASKVGRPGATDAERKYIDCGVWRYHPTRRDFEPVAYGTTNPWGLDWDDYGEMFITNCVIKHLFHVVPGGHYERMFGSDPNPHVYGLMQSCADHIHWAGGHWTESRGAVGAHSDAGGGHAHSGCSVYLGDNFPPEYRNNVFMCNIHGARLNRDRLERQGSGYVAKHESDFLFANDPWHRGLAVKYGPDGGLYVADWCDTGECHNYEVADVTNGRIVKVKYQGSGDRKQEAEDEVIAKFLPSRIKFDLQKLTDENLFVLQSHTNDWFVRHARRILQERAAAKTLRPETRVLLGMMFSEDPEATQRLRALWALHATGGVDERDLLAALSDKSEHVRGWGILLACDGGSLDNRLKTVVYGSFTHDERSHVVNRMTASALTRLPPQDRIWAFPMLLQEPAADPMQDLAYWYAFEPLLGAKEFYEDGNPGHLAVGRINTSLVRRFAARKQVFDSLAVGKTPHTEWIIEILNSSLGLSPERYEDVIVGAMDGLAGLRSLPPPLRWTETYASLSSSPSPVVRKSATKLAVIFGDEDVLGSLRKMLGDPKAAVEDRRETLELLVGKRLKDLPPTLFALLDDAALRSDALRAFAAFDDVTAAEAIVARFAMFNDGEKLDALQTLASRPSFALALLDAVEAGRIDRNEVPSGIAVQLAALKNKAVDEKLAKVWGAVRPTSEARLQQAARLKGVLSSEAVAKADAAKGRALFTKNCSACHKLFGEGGKIGPELTGSQRANVDYVLENVLDPSAKVGRTYQVTVLELADGRVVQGVVAEENDLAVTVQTQNELLTVAKNEVESRQLTKLSIMPDGLFDKLSDEEIRDLMAYLASGVGK